MLTTVHFREEHRLRCEKQVLRELLGRTEEREREREEVIENCIMRSFMFYTVHQALKRWSDQEEMAGHVAHAVKW